jgi:uncharacterized protein YecE (DUF72 family)
LHDHVGREVGNLDWWSPAAPEVTADFTYVRLHGPLTQAYQGRHKNRCLAGCIARWQHNLEHIYVYFDNDQQGFAALNL